MTSIQSVMTAEVLTAHPNDTTSYTQSRLAEYAVSALPVVGAEGELLGIVTASDILRGPPPEAPVTWIMSPYVYTLPPSADVGVAARLMRTQGIHHVVVMDGDHLAGILSTYDLLALVERLSPVEALFALTDDEWLREQRATLAATMAFLTRRTAKVEGDLHREAGPLERSRDEQAASLVNEDVLAALSREGKDQLGLVSQALTRLRDGTYERCGSCGGVIARERLRALPYADACIACAKRREAG